MKVNEDIQKFYDVPNNKTLINKYLQESLFDVIGKNRSESAHTNFLKWFFSQKEWNKKALKLFLKLIFSNFESNRCVDLANSKVEAFDWDKCEISLYGDTPIETEYPCFCKVNNKKKRGAVDLVIDCKVCDKGNTYYLKMIIENKIDSPESNDQTWRYYVFFSNNDIDCSQREEGKASITVYKDNKYIPEPTEEKQLFVLLSPYVDIASVSSRGICDKYIRVLYQELYDDVIKPVLHSLPEDIDCKKRIYLDEYYKNLISPVLNKKDKYKRIMVFEKEDIEKLKAFWYENLPLFKMAAEVVVKNSIDAEEIEAVSDISRSIENLNIKSKHYDLLLPDGNAYEGLLMKEVAMNVVSYMLNKRVEIKAIKELFPNSGWLQSMEEFREGQKTSKDVRYSDRRNLINGEFYLSNQWTSPKFTYFKEKLHEAFPEIRITLHESE